MELQNPQNGKKYSADNPDEARQSFPHRRAARMPSKLTKPQNRQNAVNNGGTAGNRTQADKNMHAGNTGASQSASERLPVHINPREQLRMLELDGAQKPQRAEAVRRPPARTQPAKPVEAPLPREVQFEVPVIDPEILRQNAAKRQTESLSGARTEVYATGKTADKRVTAPKPAKPLPKRVAGSSGSGRVRIGYKRADEFLPEKLVVTRDKRVVSEEAAGAPDEEDAAIEEKEPAKRGSALTSLLKAIVYIVFVLTVSGFLSYFVITIGNDVFAFVKPDNKVAVTVPEFATIDNIADILYEKGVIKYPYIFKIYAFLRNDNGDFVAGEYTVTPSMNYDQLRATLKGPVKEREQILITIPEGYTVDQIIDLFVNKYHMGTREGFINAIENGNFDNYWFIAELEPKEGRKYRLEGYLYPDTYYFFTDWSEEQILRKLLNNFAAKFDIAYKERCKELGMTVDELITLASMIEAEGKFTYEFGAISAVFHNRLKNPSVTGGKLESDATIQYVLPERHEELTADDLALDSPYNTYIYPGLPPGPITNPTLNAIHSAMYPDDVNYYYFVARPNGQNLFAVTYQEHLTNKQLVAQEKAAMKNQG